MSKSSVLEKLSGELDQSYKSANYTNCNNLLPKIKFELIKHNLLIPNFTKSSPISNQQINDYKITKRILEIGALSALYTSNLDNFEKNLIQLKPFYFNEKITNLNNDSANDETTKLISLYLLHLLSQGSISKFHIELEVLYNQKNLKIDEFISFPINLEKNLMEGNYIKIWKLINETSSFPCQEFNFFIEKLIVALRFEISNSIEKTYNSLPINSFKDLLYFSSKTNNNEILEFINGRENWVLENGVILFKVDDLVEVNNNEVIINNVLGYASEIETIV